MVRKLAIALLIILPMTLAAQEELRPLYSAPRTVPLQMKSSDTLVLPFFDDFASYKGAPDAALWLPGGGYVEPGNGELPPTVGMLTLDALDADGSLYTAASTSIFPADTVASRPINTHGYSESDSLILSFYYLPGGGYGNMWERIGDTPDAGDSLFLEFYDRANDQWTTVWSRGGISVDTLIAHTGLAWQLVTVTLTDAYLDSAFQFRFRNYCSIESSTTTGRAGNCDQWHIDYVQLGAHRTVTDCQYSRDVAFSAPAPSMLSNYRIMPALQYRASEMSTALALTINNLYSTPLASHYGYAVVDAMGDTIHRYDGGYENAPAYLPEGNHQTAQAHTAPTVGYAFPESDEQTYYDVVHFVREGVSGDQFGGNDTIRFRQQFADYYAYDDGTAEEGYGLTSTAASVYLAYRFDLNAADTLSAVDLYFNETCNHANEAMAFYITIWQAEEGKPGTVLYRDQTRRFPSPDGLNSYHRYILEHGVVVNGSIFVGFEQASSDFINLGFDRSFNTASRIWSLTDNEWKNSILSGSLMIRPYFGTAATVGIATLTPELCKIWPNPAADKVTIEISPLLNNCTVAIYDLYGRRRVMHIPTPSENGVRTLDVRELPDGVYLLILYNSQSAPVSQKLLIQHR